ncbi:MAG: IMP cyclohydrolase / Phosphoribosylaminoimidazolecarboxamide formyltransferase, partial [uncultured Chloroflexia bacterium]
FPRGSLRWFSQAAPYATRRSSPQPTGPAWPWCSQASATSGT